MPVRAKDIAKMLGVSQSAVSIVLNNRDGVSEETRSLILNKIHELNCDYLLKFNLKSEIIPMGGDYRAKGSSQIGFCIYKRGGEILNEAPFFNYALYSISGSLRQYGYSIKFLYLDSEMDSESMKKVLEDSDCEGFIFYAVEMLNEDLDRLLASNFPYVMLDNSFRERNIDSVSINNTQGIRSAFQFCYECGHRKIGYLKCNIRLNSFEERFREYKHQLNECNILFNPEYVATTGYSEKSVNETMKEFLKKDDLPTVLICDNDLLAAHAIKPIKERGLRIPEDISLIGFDNRPLTSATEPALSTVNVPLDLFGSGAVNLLLNKISTGRQQTLKMEIGTNLMIRDSVAVIK